MRIRFLSLICILLLCVAVGHAAAKSVDISVSHDAQVVKGKSDENFGSSNNIYIASAGSGDFQDERGWLKFDLSKQIPQGASITTATLRFYCWSADDTDNMIVAVLGSLDDSWTETGITWDSQPAMESVVLDQVELKANEKGFWVEWDVTDFVNSQQTGDRTVSLVIKPASEGETRWHTYAFDAREYSGSLAPRLRVDYSGNWPESEGYKIFHINDAHSRLLPHEMDVPEINDVPVFEKVGGAACMASKLIELKGKNPDALILDAGDISEGNPLGDIRTNGGMIDFYNLLDSKLKALGGRGIDAVVVGNHDVRKGEMLTNMLNANFPFISMNLYYVSGDNAGERVFPAWVTVDVNGKKIGVLGYTTDTSAYLGESTANWIEVKKCIWSDTDADTLDIKDYVKQLRETENCDAVVLLSHIGHSRIVSGSDALLEASGEVAPPEVVIAGHWHTITDTAWQPSQLDYRTTINEAASYMQYIGELEMDGNGRYVQAQKHVIRNSQITPDADVAALVANLIQEYNNSGPAHALDEVIGYSAVDLSMDKDKWWTLNEYPWSATNSAGAWITDAMAWKLEQMGVKCDLAIQSGGSIRRDVPAGWITYGQIYEAYPWSDNNMSVLTLTGQEIWDALEGLYCGASISSGWEVHALDGVISAIYYRGEAIDKVASYKVAVSSYMAEHENAFSGKTPVEVDAYIREAVVAYTRQFTEANPLTVGSQRYHLNTEFAGGFKAVVTMMADTEQQPYYEAAFLRLLEVTSDTLERRAGYGLSDLVKSDGTINTENRLSEIMWYRSHLGFRDGILKPGDIVEVRGEGGFYAGNPQLVDQQGIESDGNDIKILGHDNSLATPEYMGQISDFMNEAYENHLVKFHATKTGENTVEDAAGKSLTVYAPGGYYAAVLPGDAGDILEITGVNTMRFEERRFRLRTATLASDQSVVGFPPTSRINVIAPFRQTGPSITLTATAKDSPAEMIAWTGFEEAATGDDYVDTGDAGSAHALENNTGQMAVNFTSNGGELGFTSYYTNTRNSTGLGDGDKVGVTDYTTHVGSFPTGDKGLIISDPDGKVTVRFETLDLSDLPSAEISLSYFLNNTGWEGDETARIYVEVDGGQEIDLLNTSGQDIDDLGIEGAWKSLTASLDGYTLVTLVVEFDSNSAAEALYIDDIHFKNPEGAGTWTDPKQVEFFYRYSPDSTSWTGWTSAGTLTGSPWEMAFDYPQGMGYYQFASVATDEDGNVEDFPVKADTSVHLADGVNDAPGAVSAPSIPSGSSDIGSAPVLSVTVSDPEYDLVDVYFYDAQGELIGVVYGVASGQVASVFWTGLEQGQKYGWYVIVDDGANTTQSDMLTFTTVGYETPSETIPVPAVGSMGLIVCTLLLLSLGMTVLRCRR